MAGYYANYGPNAYSAGTSEDENKQYDTASTPVDNQLYDYSQQAQPAADNPYATAEATTDTSSFDTTPTQEQTPQETTPQQPQTTAEMTQAAAEANSNTHEALRDVTSDEMNNIYQKTGVSADEWARITSPGFNVQGLMADTNPERQKYRDAINMYMGFAQSAAPAATPAPTQAPAQETAPQQNPILPSAGGNYQADSIYDPSKTYGRQPDGSYVYSSSAAQLQRDLNRTMNAGLAVDGYFGTETQKALDAYLSQYGKPTGSAKGDESYKMYDAPIGPALPPQTTPATTQTPVTTPTPEPTSAPAALAASAAEAPAATETPAPAQTPEQSVYQPKPLSNSNTLNDEHFLRYYNSGMDTVDKAYNSMLKSKPGDIRTAEWYADAFADWLDRGGPEATYASRAQKDAIEESGRSMDKYYRDLLGLQNQPEIGGTEPDSTETQHGEPINYAAMLDELNQMDRNDWYQRPENQATNAQPEREPINYNAMADELFQMDRNDWYQRPEAQQASDTPTSSRGLGGRPMGSQRPETPYSFEEDNQEPAARFGDTAFARGVKDIAELFTSGTPFMWGDRPLFSSKEPTQSKQSQPIEYSDAFIRQQDMNDAYSPRQSFNDNYRAQLEDLQREPIEYSDAFIRQEETKDSYSPYADYSGSMSSDDVQASTATAPRASQVGDSMSRALADNQARPDTNIFREDAPPVVSPQREEQYKTLFGNEMAALKQMYPDASYNQLYDYLRLFYEQNGDTNTEYYRWFNSFL